MRPLEQPLLHTLYSIIPYYHCMIYLSFSDWLERCLPLRVVHGCCAVVRYYAKFMQCFYHWYVRWYAMVCDGSVSASRDACRPVSVLVCVVWCGYDHLYTQFLSALCRYTVLHLMQDMLVRRVVRPREVFHRLSILPTGVVPMRYRDMPV